MLCGAVSSALLRVVPRLLWGLEQEVKQKATLAGRLSLCWQGCCAVLVTQVQ